MLLVVVWGAVAVLTLVVLGSLAFSTRGAVQRLRRELAGLGGELRPVLEQVQQTAARAQDPRGRPAGAAAPRGRAS